MSVLAEIGPAVRGVAAQIDAAVVAVGRDRRGSGVVIAANRVLTNAHNLRDRSTLVTFADGRAVQGRVIGADPDGDLVVLDVDTASVAPMAIDVTGGDAPGLGDAVLAAGRAADGLRISVGFVSGVQRGFRGPRGRQIAGGVEHTAAMARGSSGGPLRALDGRVIGINTHRIGRGFYVARATDEALVARLAELRDGRSVRPRQLGVALAPSDVAGRLRRAVGLEERPGLLVRDVAEGSPAARAGLREGDLLVQAGTTALASVDDLHAALAGSDDEPLVIGLVRGTDERTVTVTFEVAADAGTADGTGAGTADAGTAEAG
ncbi:MAG: trypsin-like peptidase domain-containing protein [Acidimicrobiales bacterium]|nr:trypsin-like peptidase domain-containing protein [Acidimicrobiales bacterium]